jgi:hypothetical protein
MGLLRYYACKSTHATRNSVRLAGLEAALDLGVVDEHDVEICKQDVMADIKALGFVEERTEMKTILEENGEIETQQAAEFDVQADEEPQA